MSAGKLALGTVQFGLDYGIANTGGRVSPAEVSRIVHLARAAGVDTLDTAPAYGHSEAVLGREDLTGLRVITKTPVPNEGPQAAADRLRQSTEALGRVPYAWLYHRFTDWSAGRLPWAQARRIADAAGVEKVGFSLYDPAEWDRLLAAGVVPDLIQVPYNLFDRRFARRVFSEARDRGTEIHVRSVFLQGLFFRDPCSLPSNLTPAAPPLMALGRRAADPASVATLALRFVAADERVDRLVVGVQSADQLTSNLAALAGGLPDLPPLDDLKTDDPQVINPSLWNR